MSRIKKSPFEISAESFRESGHYLVDVIADFLQEIHTHSITTGKKPSEIHKMLGDHSLPAGGSDPKQLFERTSELLINNSLFNGHPKFYGYITGSPAPVGILAEILAAAINPNVGAQILSPVATEIEKQTIKWLCEFIGVPNNYGGILVSGGNMANFTAFLAGRTAKAGDTVKENGLERGNSIVYCSKTTHTWIEKAANLFGLGTNSIRWIETDNSNKLSTKHLVTAIEQDIKDGKKPMMVIGTAGDVSTGVVDNLEELAAVSKKYDLWFHVDGAYGIPAAVVPEERDQFRGIEHADSIALDPHKWLYSPLEAGCTLVKNPQHLTDTYSSHPAYYNFNASGEQTEQNFYEYGFQNSRGFRALKVWMMLQHIGRDGYVNSIREDIGLAEHLYKLSNEHPDLESFTRHLSIATLRYKPDGFVIDGDKDEELLNQVNEQLLNQLQVGGEVFLSNAVIEGKYCLRACIVNFRTTVKDIEETIEIIVREGQKVFNSLSNKH